MLDYLSTEKEVGYYYSADKLINFPLGVTTAISSVMLPRIVNVISNNNRESVNQYIRKAMELTVFLVSATSFGIAAVAREFVPIFFGAGYEPCVELIYFFVPVLLIKTLESTVCSQNLIPTKKDNQYTLALFGGAFVNIISNILLIPRFGALGAVLGTLFAEFTVLVLDLFFAREVPFLVYFSKQFSYIVFGAVMFVVVRFVSRVLIWGNWINLCVLVFVGAVVYILMCLILWKTCESSIFRNEIDRAIIIIKKGRNDG